MEDVFHVLWEHQDGDTEAALLNWLTDSDSFRSDDFCCRLAELLVETMVAHADGPGEIQARRAVERHRHLHHLRRRAELLEARLAKAKALIAEQRAELIDYQVADFAQRLEGGV